MESYEEMVNKWYGKLQGEFVDSLMSRYNNSKLKKEDAENIYQDVFMAIRENFIQGSIKENTCWRNYIWKIGMNMASKLYRALDKIEVIDDYSTVDAEYYKKQNILKNDKSMFEDSDIMKICTEEIRKFPYKQAELLRMYYIGNMRDSEIFESGEFDYSSVSTVKVVRNRIFRQFKEKVMARLEAEINIAS